MEVGVNPINVCARISLADSKMTASRTQRSGSALRVVIVEDDAPLAELLGDYLADHPQFVRPKVFEHPAAAVAGIREFRPHLVLVDLRLVGSSGVDCIRRIRNAKLPVKVLAFTSSSDEEAIVGALKAGADGYLLKQPSLAAVAESLLAAWAGQPVISDAALKILGSFRRPEPAQTVTTLSPAERAVLDLTVDGLDCKAIARQLGISVHTVYIHNKSIIKKLGVTNRHAAAALWREQRG